ncbi:NADH-ubiquinone oxidoreductase 75 kDa subunit, mitochondrial [Papilio machaon]|uniref:NADH-ubiquinone oxidoreductase 75 kDa subunit, mitochondrial n=1 Tax=Papilio machaon TaxID=76193 RepID=A0A194QTG0_PAPMA|nr:NADH-ubiquinone oxidoreductase 75 kDa subunit, mitochondrial [Papilio machaon]
MFRVCNKLIANASGVFQKIPRRTQSKNVNVFINGKAVEVPSYFTVLQALRRERVTVPTFCYHDRLSIAGNCRMCLVEIEGGWKPQIACATPVYKDIKIRTNSKMALQAQEGVLEFILADHPLDCPICDQGGECDLQDLTMRFGNDRTRFTDIHFQGKRAVENKNLSTLIRAEMTRCIHCTRCIRFASQVCGMDVLGPTGRGGEMLVGTYVDKKFFSELSGNIIDLCPVGALTAIPYMFKARPWEVKRVNSIDVTDATGTNIILNQRFNRVLRVLPRENNEVNQEWLSDKGRWAIDSLEMQRLVTPMCRDEDGSLVPIEWDVALKLACKLLKEASSSPNRIMAIAGPHCSVETLVTCKDLLNVIGCENTYVERSLAFTGSDADLRSAYSLNVSMKDIAKADKILLVGTNPRFEAPILNTWIRQAYIFNECDIYVIGPECEYNYHVEYLGSDMRAIPSAGCIMRDAKKPLIFVGVSQLGTDFSGGLMNSLCELSKSLNSSLDWGVLNIVTLEASFGGAMEVGWKPGALAALDVHKPTLIISLGADDTFYDWTPPCDCAVIYIGFQGDRGAENSSLILPGCAYTESGGTFVNMEGRVQFALPAVSPPGKARHDWKIIRALAETYNIPLFYCDMDTLACRLGVISPNLVQFDKFQPKLFSDVVCSMIDHSKTSSGCIDVKMKTIKDYFCSDVFTFNSPTMVKAQKAVTDFQNTSQYVAI